MASLYQEGCLSQMLGSVPVVFSVGCRGHLMFIFLEIPNPEKKMNWCLLFLMDRILREDHLEDLMEDTV